MKAFIRISMIVLILASSTTYVAANIVLNITPSNITAKKYVAAYPLVTNGSVVGIASGGTAPYTYKLFYPSGDSSVRNFGYYADLDAGTYIMVVTDATGATATQVFTVSYVYPQPTLTLTGYSGPSKCDASDGMISLSASGGLPPYSYSIDGGISYSVTSTFPNLSQGTYMLLVKDANGQIAAAQPSAHNGPEGVLLSVAGTCSLLGFISYLEFSCTNEADLNIRIYTAAHPASYSFDGVHYSQISGGGTAEGYDYDSTGLAPGVYHVYLKDSIGNQLVQTCPILPFCYTAVATISIDASCQQSDGGMTITATKGTPPYAYTLDGINFQPGNTFTGLTAGNYTLTVRDANGQTVSVTATVFNKCPTVTAVETNENCTQKDGTITATGHKGSVPYQFSIDGVNFQTASLFPDLDSGTYTVTIRDALGYKESTSIKVGQNCLQMSLSTVNTTCSNRNGSITVQASNGTSPYEYSLDGTNYQASNVFTGLPAGTYTVYETDAAGLSKQVPVDIGDAPAPQLNVVSTPASCTNTNGSITITPTGGTSPLQFSIDDGAHFNTNPVFNGLDSGQYIVLIRDANGCSAADSIDLSALPTPVVSLGADTVLCNGQSLSLIVPLVAGDQYVWQDNSTSNTFFASSSGVYSVTVTNPYRCSATTTKSVRFRPLPLFTLGNDTTLCNGQTLLPNPVFTQILPVYSYLWSNGSTNSQGPKLNTSGVYWLQVSDSGCTYRDSIQIRFQPNPLIDLGSDTTVCTGQTLVLDATNTLNVLTTYTWQDGSSQPTFTVTRAGTYSVKATANGCDTTGKIIVQYTSKPNVILGKDTTLCITEQLTLDAFYAGAAYQWQDGTTNPDFHVTQPGMYTVDIKNSCGVTRDSLTVTYENCACKFYMPSGFTPNNDGVNDIFVPRYKCVFSQYELKVFNRWGQLVFRSTSPAIGWDGNFKNRQAPAGTYVWELGYKDNLTGKTSLKTGTILLIR